MPTLFVLLWSTGFIGAKFGLPYAEPYVLLFFRFILALALLAILIVYFRQPMPTTWRERFHLMVSGSLIHGAYLGGVFSAIKLGLPAGICALIVGLQPMLTTIAAPILFGEKINRIQWLGVFLGILGLYIMLSTRDGQSAPLNNQAILAALVALGGITTGVLYQKKFCGNNSLLSSAFFQYIPTAVIFGIGALLFETGHVVLTSQLILSVIWLAVGLSIGAILLLMYLIKHGEIHKVSSLFYLVPVVTALEASWLFDEKLGADRVAGIIIVAVSVFVVTRRSESISNMKT
jgi:drug/metabolite transporter (DMT)-like permease